MNLKKSHKSLIRNAYYGGRCEILGNPREGEKIFHFDFPGMYQNCMLQKLPYGEFTLEECPDNKIKNPGFYYIIIEFENLVPVLPTKGEKLYFRTGRISGWYWHEEIELAIAASKVSYLKIVCGLVTSDYDYVLKDFILNLNKIRELGGIKKDIGKLLINSFYGRMGIGDEVDLIELKKKITDDKIYGMIDDNFITKRKISKTAKANVAIAASITAKARIRLYKALLAVQESGGRVLYCDTDSIVAAFKEGAVVENKYIGEVFFDTGKPDTVIKDAVFISPKTYGLLMPDGREIIKIKGINLVDISFYELKRVFYSNTEFMSFNSCSFFKKNLSISISSHPIEINLQSYTKRKWSFDKKETTPHSSPEVHPYK